MAEAGDKSPQTLNELYILLRGELALVKQQLDIYDRQYRASFEQHLRESGGHVAEFKKDIAAAHRRLDTHKEEVDKKLKESEIKVNEKLTELAGDVDTMKGTKNQFIGVVLFCAFLIPTIISILAFFITPEKSEREAKREATQQTR